MDQRPAKDGDHPKTNADASKFLLTFLVPSICLVVVALFARLENGKQYKESEGLSDEISNEMRSRSRQDNLRQRCCRSFSLENRRSSISCLPRTRRQSKQQTL